MLLDLVAIAAGLMILLIGGDVLVRGAVALALRLCIPPLIVSLTIVALGTSAPELLIAVGAVLEDAPDLAFGNVVGSNIANVLLVLGVPALITPLAATEKGARRTYIYMIGATLMLIGFAFAGPIGFVQAAVFLAFFAYFLFDTFRLSQSGKAEVDDLDAPKNLAKWRIAAMLIAGLIALPVGADIMVEGAVRVASALGVSEAVIGLTIVAIGTSLPELATTVMAALRRETAVAIGNVIGSNLFNILFILGVAGMVGELPPPHRFLHFDLWVMIGAALVLAPAIMLKRSVTMAWGVAFLALYGLYLGSLIV